MRFYQTDLSSYKQRLCLHQQVVLPEGMALQKTTGFAEHLPPTLTCIAAGLILGSAQLVGAYQVGYWRASLTVKFCLKGSSSETTLMRRNACDKR